MGSKPPLAEFVSRGCPPWQAARPPASCLLAEQTRTCVKFPSLTVRYRRVVSTGSSRIAPFRRCGSDTHPLTCYDKEPIELVGVMGEHISNTLDFGRQLGIRAEA